MDTKTTLLLIGALGVGPAGAAPEDSVRPLQEAYLACDRLAVRQRLAPTEAVACSVVGERLLREGFDGDWERLLAWWRQARAADARPAGPARSSP